jgi:hypothetical protein
MIHKIKKADVLAAAKSFYHLTFSYSGNNENDALWHLQRGGKVAIVFVRERLERYKGEAVRRGATVVDVSPDVVRSTLHLPRGVDTKTVTLLGQLLKYADSGTYNKDSDLGRYLRANGLSLPADPHPSEREFWAAETASHMGFRFAPNDFKLPLGPTEKGQLRSEFAGKWFYGFRFPKGSPFADLPILNADRNDLRSKDALIMQRFEGKDGPAIVGLDFKVAKIRIALDEYAIVVKHVATKGKSEGEETKRLNELAVFPTQQEAETALKTGQYPRNAFVRRLGELSQVKLDLEKNTFVTPVYKEGEVFYVAQTPPQTMDGSQEHG